MAFCRSLVVAFATASNVVLIMKIERTALARKMSSFSAPSQICLVIKLRVYRRLPLDCLGFKLNLSRHKAVYVKRTKDEAPHPKDKVNLRSLSIFCASSSSFLLSSVPNSSVILAEWQSPLTTCLAITK